MTIIKTILLLALFLPLGSGCIFAQSYINVSDYKYELSIVSNLSVDTLDVQSKLNTLTKPNRRRNCVIVAGGIRFFEITSMGELFSSKEFNKWLSYMISYEIILGASEINYLGIEVYTYTSSAGSQKERIYVPSFSYRHKFEINDKISTSFKFGINLPSQDWSIFALVYQSVYLTYNIDKIEWFANIKTDIISGTPTFFNVGVGVQF